MILKNWQSLFLSFLFFLATNCATQHKSKPIVEKPLPIEEKIIHDCEIVTLLSPVNNQKLDGRKKSGCPTFTWRSNIKEESNYHFKLFRMEKGKKVLLFETKTTKNSVDWPESVEWINKNEEEEIIYSWQVESLRNVNDVKGNYKEIFSTSFRSVTGLLEVYPELMIAECLGYDSVGNVCYAITENWRIVNDRYPMVYLSTNATHTVTANGGGIVPITNFSSTPAGFPPSTLNVSGTDYLFTLSYKVCVPLGVNSLRTELGYRDTQISGNNTNSSYDYRVIPLLPCDCDYCDMLVGGIDAQVTGSALLHSTTDPMYDELVIRVGFNYPNLLYRVNAEIIEFEHYFDGKNPVCTALCNKKDDSYGTFTDGPLFIEHYPSFSNYVNRMIPFSGWKNNAFPYGYTNNDGSSVSRELVWESDNGIGVNIANTFQILTIGLPEYNACCEDAFKICIRYSFTNTECKVCEKVVCYEFRRNNRSVRVLPSVASVGNEVNRTKKNYSETEKISLLKLNEILKNQ